MFRSVHLSNLLAHPASAPALGLLLWMGASSSLLAPSNNTPTTCGTTTDLWLIESGPSGPTQTFIGDRDALRIHNSPGVTTEYKLYDRSTSAFLCEVNAGPGTNLFELAAQCSPVPSSIVLRETDKTGATDDTADTDGVCIIDCLAPEVPVWIAGELVPAGQVRAGGSIVELRSAGSYHLVAIDVDGERLRTSRGHEFRLASGDWIAAQDLAEGDRLSAGPGDSAVRVLGVEVLELEQPVRVYDLRTEQPGELRVGLSGLVTRTKAATKFSLR